MMAALVIARHFPTRRLKFEATIREYLGIVDTALSDCDPEKVGTQMFYDEAEVKIHQQAAREWLKQFKELHNAAKEIEP